MYKKKLKKKDSSSSKVSASGGQTPSKESASLFAVSSEKLGSQWRCRCPIWPEWSDADVNKEKWDSSKGPEDGKTKDKSPHAPFYEDPEGKIHLLPSLNVHSWKRPSEFLDNKSPTIVENENTFDLISANNHLTGSEVIRWIISEICILWAVCNSASTKRSGWRPWEHIYSLCKAEKGHVPLYNIYGKYVVRIYWMGCWRKVTVDDSMPFDEQNNLLLPASTCQSELWPMLLAKALLKVANTNVVSHLGGEIGELSFIHTLTGWIPEITPIKSMHIHKVWDFLRDSIPMFKLPDENFQERVSQASNPSTGRSSVNSCKSKSKESDKNQGTTEKVVCAGFYPFQLFSNNACAFGEMANSSEILRRYGFSLLYSHIVLLTMTRSCKLEAPPKPPPVPRWKLIRPRKEIKITDEPQKLHLSRPEQFIEVASLFLSYHIKSSIGSGPELDVKQSTQWQQNLESIGESENTECREDLGPAETETRTPSTTSTYKSEVTAEDRKDGDDICTAHSNVVTKEPTTPELSTPLKPMLHETWVDLDDFAKCFQNLLVFHKSHSYQHHFQKSHFKNTILFQTTSVISSTGGTTSSSATGSYSVLSAVSSPQCTEERGTYYLCVDSLEPSQILIHFSALLVWGKTAEEKNDVKAVCRPAVLLAQPHSWKSMQCQLPLLTIKTTSSKAATLTLTPGRHVLCIHAKAALGYNVHLYSTTPFIFGDEETIMSHLTKESVRFIEQASTILRAMTRVVYNFTDEKELPAAKSALQEAHCPQHITSTVEKWEHHRVFNMAVYHMLREALDRKLLPDERFAMVALTADPSLIAFDPREDAHTLDEDSKFAESWRNRQLTEKEIQAVTLLQAGFKGCFVRKIFNASKPGTKQNISASKILLKMWPNVESDAEEHAISLLRNIIEHSKMKEQLYPCQQDEWTKIAVAEYSVSLQEQTASSWALVFREVFQAPKEMMLLPKVYSSIPCCPLHIIDNDTGEEIHKIFGKVAPHVFPPNKLGYTLVAEAITPEAPPIDSKWKIYLIGTRGPLPKLACESPLNKFSVKELRDYYVPTEKNLINLICRYSVQVTKDCLVTLHFQTSNPDVLIHLSVLDQEKEVNGHTGKGHVVIPVCHFLANQAPSCIAEENKSQKESPTQDNCAKMADAPHQSNMENSTSGKPDSWPDLHHSPTETTILKYVVQAEVLHKSWVLDASQLAFVHMLRDVEKNELKGGHKLEELIHSSEAEATTNERQKTNKPSRSGEGEKTKGKQRASSKSNTSQEMSFDLTMPHWTLRVVTDKTQAESIKIKKDTERMDQIRAIKAAWETAEAGRAAKALQSRLKFLHKVQRQASDDKTTDAASSLSNLELTSASYPPMDYTPFIRQQKEFPVLMDLQTEEAQKKEWLEKIQSWQLVRDTVLEHRAQEALNRQKLRKYQLDLYGKMQASQDRHKNA